MSNDTQVAAHMALVDYYVEASAASEAGHVEEARAAVEASARQLAEQPGFVMVQSPITEEMHVAAVKVLHRANGVDGLPQRMLDAMTASPTAPSTEASEPVRDERAEFEAWYFDRYLAHPEWHGGRYESHIANQQWIAWQARALKGTP